MSKLIKYEFRKTWPAKLVVLAFTLIAEIVFLVGVFGDNPDRTGIGIALLALTAMFGIFAIGVQSLVILHRDMSTKQSYMLFMTPNSRWAILGAKVLENGLSVLLSGAFFALLALGDLSLLLGKNHQLEQLWTMIQDVWRSFNAEIELNQMNFLLFALFIVISWVNTVMTAVLADVVACALLNGKRFSGLIAFILFLVLNYLTAKIGSLVGTGASFSDRMLIENGLELVFAVIMYLCSATIMERRLSV